jgi:nitrite reductase/ring-hydroxylating ferredoxin subunit
MAERFARLESWTSERYPVFAAPEYRWSGQVLEPVDFLPFSGRNPGNDRVFIHSGDSGQGITNAVAGSLTILPLLLGEHSRFSAVFDPGRISLSAARNFAEGLISAATNLTEHLGPGEITSPDQLAPDEGAIVRQGTKKLAAYRSPEGELVLRSATCTHMGCIVHWNTFERCWDCPCHGSQFAVDGSVLNGPALSPLGHA